LPAPHPIKSNSTYQIGHLLLGRRNAAGAADEILLPIAAVAFGMTTMGIVLHGGRRRLPLSLA